MGDVGISVLLGVAILAAVLAYRSKPRKPPMRRQSAGYVNGEDHL